MTKQDPGVEITAMEYVTAHTRYHGYFFEKDPTRVWPSKVFARFLGMQNGLKATATMKPLMVRESAARKIRALCGPHWRTLLTAHEIRKQKRPKK